MGKIIKSAAVMIVGLVMFAGSASAAWTAKVYADLNLRAGPSTRYAVIDTIHYGDRVRVHKCKRGWCRVSYHGNRGWASRKYLTGAKKKYAKHRHKKYHKRKHLHFGHSYYRGPVYPFHPFFRPRIRSGFGVYIRF